MKTETWTRDDDRRLEEMQERKERVLKARLDPLRTLVAEDMPHIRSHQADDIADWLVKHADNLRDLLAPFDSGVRVAPANPLTDTL